jgi:hypothetical protein
MKSKGGFKMSEIKENQVTLHNNQFLDPPIKPHDRNDEPEQTAKIVAEMPGDDEMRDRLQEMKEHDGYPGSCGINPQS